MPAGHHRYAYSPISARADYKWLDDKRLAVYVAVHLEHFASGEGPGAEVASGASDVLHSSSRDYGHRVGAWRLLTLFEQLKMPVTLLVHSRVYEDCPQLVEAYRKRGAEIVAHGRGNAERQAGMSEADEKALIAEVTQTLKKHEKMAPLGWLSPGSAESRATPDLLEEAGYSYVLDWCCDDQPIWLRTRGGPLLAIPFSQEIDDLQAIVARRHSAREFADMIIDNFDEMLTQSRQQPLVCGISLHPCVMGQPFRLLQLRRALRHVAEHADRVWMTRAGDIADYVQILPAGVVP